MVSKNLSVCLSVSNFDLNYLRTGEIDDTTMKIGIRIQIGLNVMLV